MFHKAGMNPKAVMPHERGSLMAAMYESTVMRPERMRSGTAMKRAMHPTALETQIPPRGGSKVF